MPPETPDQAHNVATQTRNSLVCLLVRSSGSLPRLESTDVNPQSAMVILQASPGCCRPLSGVILMNMNIDRLVST